MSSELLQQAMIDAAALKEAAMKNAENALIEKYSAEFNQTVQKLLEQEDLTTAETTPTDPAATPDLSAAVVDPISAATDMTVSDKAFNNVPGAFSGGSDDEMITINFDQIKATLNEMLGVAESHDTKQQDPTRDALGKGGNPEVVVKVAEKSENEIVEEKNVIKVHVGAGNSAEQEELELELEEEDMGDGGGEEMMELEEVELEEQADVPVDSRVATAKANVARAQAELSKAELGAADKLADEQKKQEDAAKAQAAKDAATAGTGIPSVTENIELTVEELQELAEELKVDLKVGNLSDGYMGSTETQKREQRNVELAAARDEKAAAEREEEKKKMGDLMKENAQLKTLNNDALSAVAALKEQVEKLNLLNAKLLYTNKALANISLNERQKNNIVESISKADSVLAAKTIYETVQNAVDNKQEREAPQSLRETLNRAATPFVVKKNANNSVNDLMAARMKALAGIK